MLSARFRYLAVIFFPNAITQRKPCSQKWCTGNHPQDEAHMAWRNLPKIFDSRCKQKPLCKRDADGAGTVCCKIKPLLVSSQSGLHVVIKLTAFFPHFLQPIKLTASVHTESLIHGGLRSYVKDWVWRYIKRNCCYKTSRQSEELMHASHVLNYCLQQQNEWQGMNKDLRRLGDRWCYGEAQKGQT